MSLDSRADVETIKRSLADPREVCRRLGLDPKAKPQGGGGLMILCPAHGERTPSCSVSRGPDGTLRVKCFGCDFAGDVFDLLAVVERLDRVRDFPELLRRAAELAHVELERDASRPPAKRAQPRPAPPVARAPIAKPYPPADEIGALWALCRAATEDPEVGQWLEGRGLAPAAIARYDVARALPAGASLPPWASYRGDPEKRAKAEPWAALGYRLVVPLYDAGGVIRSVRARAIVPTDGPKALPPTGYAAKGLIMADPLASMMLALGEWPEHAEKRVVISEGEPDFLTWASRGTGARTLAVLGLAGSGQWTKEIADRIPDGSTVIVRTDQDDAGDRYAEQITATLWGRCTILETDPDARRARRATRSEREAEARKQSAGASKSRR
jgi:DNA primase